MNDNPAFAIAPFAEQADSKAALEDILARCYKDSKFMAKLLFPDAFFAPMTVLHDQLFDFLDNCDAKKKLIIATRGLGKTTIAQFLAMKRILFTDRAFIGYLSNSSTSAQFYTNTIKADLTSTQEIRKIFGDVRQSNLDGVDEKWATTSFVANVADSQTLVVPRGAGQQVRGLLWNHRRPDCWIIDDLEDDENITSEEQRNKLKKWFYGAFMYTVSQWERYTDYEMIYVDTIKHEDALITYLSDDNDWEVLELSVCDENYKTKVPDFLSQETIDKELENHRRNKTMDVFARERMCQATSKEAAAFRAEYFKYYDENEERFVKEVKPRLVNVLLCDPSRTKNPKNAQTAFVVYGLDLEYNAFYVRLAQGWYLSPSEMHTKFIELARRYQVVVAGIEAAGLEEHILHPLKNELIRQRMYGLPLIDLRPRTGKGELTGEEGGKDGRIRSLLPYFESGLVWINTATAGSLEQQLLSFPRSKLKDVSDCAGYLGQILEKGAKYMSSMDIQGDEDPRDIEREYEMLENDVPIDRKVFV